MKIIPLARQLRREAELWACDVGYSRNLLMQCGVVSAAFVLLAQRVGHPATMTGGDFLREDGGTEGHWWALVGAHDDLLFDLTATQFDGGWPPVVCLGRADPRRARWQAAPFLRDATALVMFARDNPRDHGEALELLERVERAAWWRDRVLER